MGERKIKLYSSNTEKKVIKQLAKLWRSYLTSGSSILILLPSFFAFFQLLYSVGRKFKFGSIATNIDYIITFLVGAIVKKRLQ
jgi:hypothetical protein